MLREHPFQAGCLFSLYLLLAGMERLLIEQIRVNPPYSFAGIHATQAQLITAGMIAAGLIGLALLTRRGEGSACAQGRVAQ
ncbi:prolipoprotein diacylglyceryl transferase [Massilia sp. G4R7]|uniref:Prolipoprotein diacylglyceryl transferase n=1 Tax=Massilia phyllostachyos TaxID=2898585 RepID=A0ABS8Q2H2_9BURK|nr:prolipoprotein diacylglyceryl transferase [Massilia phyllostachyos]MCD2515954.1 prolipoprotein diacylglyceryl transferase [Massilia phyllostachyos]